MGERLAFLELVIGAMLEDRNGLLSPRLGVWNAVLLMPCVTKALRTPLGKRGDALLSLLGFLVFERKFPKGKT